MLLYPLWAAVFSGYTPEDEADLPNVDAYPEAGGSESAGLADADGFLNCGAVVSASPFDDDLKGFILAIDQDLPRPLEQPQRIDNTTIATTDGAKWVRMARVSFKEWTREGVVRTTSVS